MEYLSTLGIIHRDLAARNCLLDDNLVVKVSDFGLTKEIFDKDYYRAETSRPMPIFWMAIESLDPKLRLFTTASDVWSFGVLLWELLTRGQRPYYGISCIIQLYNYLKSGELLPKPDNCSDRVYIIALKCWREKHDLRPTFTELVNDLSILREYYQTNNQDYNSQYLIFSDLLANI